MNYIDVKTTTIGNSFRHCEISIDEGMTSERVGEDEGIYRL